LQSREVSKVSVVVVNWNGYKLLDDCLTALYQKTDVLSKIILVDNGSTDSSVSFVRQRFPNVKIIELAENKGFAGGNAEGLKAAEGEFIALLNNDTCVDAHWLDNVIQPMLEDSKIGICASSVLFEGSTTTESAGQEITTAGVGVNRGTGKSSSAFGSSGFIFGACGAAVLYRRKMLDEIGFLDEDFFLYDEDTDLNFRAHLAGWNCAYVPTALVYHKGNATSGRLSDLHVYYHTRNLEFVWIKNMPVGLMLRFAHHKLMQEIGAFTYLCVRHMKWQAFFRAKRDALRMMPAMWKKRAEIQRRRRVSNRYIKKILTSVFSLEIVRQKIHQLLWG